MSKVQDSGRHTCHGGLFGWVSVPLQASRWHQDLFVEAIPKQHGITGPYGFPAKAVYPSGISFRAHFRNVHA